MISLESYQMLTAVYPVFASLPVSWQQRVCSDGFTVKAESGQQAFDCGDVCSVYLMLVSGNLRVSSLMPQGREIVLYYVRPGDSCLLTVSGILGEQPYTACGTWEHDSQAFGINAELFRQLISASDPFRSFVFRSFSQRITDLLELMGVVGWKPLDARLARLLLTKGDWIHISHQRLADELGTVREVVSRYLGIFEKQGFVRLRRMQILIQDRNGLEQVAGIWE